MDTGQRAGLLTYLAIVNIRHKSRWKRLANRWVKPCKGLVPKGNAILVMYKAEVPQSQRCSMALLSRYRLMVGLRPFTAAMFGVRVPLA